MHAPPPFSLTVTRFGVWRGAGLTLAAAALCASGAWALQCWPLRAWPVVAPLTALLLLLALAARPVAPFHLRRDAGGWWVDATPGQLVAAVDLGGWLLLRFVPDGRRATRWLPVQRRGHEAAWHALRCTVYCARPPAEPLAVDL